MSTLIRSCLEARKIDVRVFSDKAPSEIRVSTFEGASGVIDFSRTELTEKILALAVSAKVPLVCGTTGFADRKKIEAEFRQASKTIPVVWDSNFSLGVEILCRASEIAALRTSNAAHITDLHHIHKKDAPSGTALKIQDRIKSAAALKVEIESIREGEIFGEHRVRFSLQDEELEFIHRAQSRRPFAEGSIDALLWVAKQNSGFYTMKDILS